MRLPINPIAERQASVREQARAGIDRLDLHAIANGPIMEPRLIFLPACMLSPAEADAREARIRSGKPC